MGLSLILTILIFLIIGIALPWIMILLVPVIIFLSTAVIFALLITHKVNEVEKQQLQDNLQQSQNTHCPSYSLVIYKTNDKLIDEPLLKTFYFSRLFSKLNYRKSKKEFWEISPVNLILNSHYLDVYNLG